MLIIFHKSKVPFILDASFTGFTEGVSICAHFTSINFVKMLFSAYLQELILVEKY